jgi:hypothetical protein
MKANIKGPINSVINIFDICCFVISILGFNRPNTGKDDDEVFSYSSIYLLISIVPSVVVCTG